jgi:hypothetical protein
MPKATQTPSHEAPSGTETKPSKSAGDSQGGFTHECTQPTNDTLLVFKYTVPTEMMTPLALRRMHLQPITFVQRSKQAKENAKER